ncbi:MAG: type II secretion system protein J [Pirellulales bacterium]
MFSHSVSRTVDAHRSSSGRLSRQRQRRALTIVEMLVATAITLLLVYAMAQAFATVSDVVSLSRSTVEMSGQLRGVALRLQRDLEDVTLPVRPWPESASALGYFEILEGPRVDYNYGDPVRYSDPGIDPSFGDYDDILMFTARSLDELFVGRVRTRVVGGNPAVDGPYQTITSNLAEIIWWAQLDDKDGNGVRGPGERYRLHRRAMLIRPDLNNAAGVLPNAAIAVANPLQVFHNDNDLSVHAISSTGAIIANSLEDLTQRVNRFAHQWSFPGLIPNIAAGSPPSITLLDPSFSQFGDFVGEDVILPHLLAWDIRVFDPGALIKEYDPDGTANTGDEEAVSPGDPGFEVGGRDLGTGAFVDLSYANLYSGLASLSSVFSGIPQPRSQLYAFDLSSSPPTFIPIPTYDTWSLAYERDAINQDTGVVVGGNPNPITILLGIADRDPTSGLPSAAFVDEAVDGLDNDWVNGVDDLLERETAPPYPVPLRGVQIRLRIVDPDTRQVRQQTVVADFTPE